MKKILIVALIAVLSLATFVSAQQGVSSSPFSNQREITQDFSIQVVDYQPKVVRSDLLEEQNVPVYAQLALTMNNPLISVPRIRNVRINILRELENVDFPSKFVSSATWFSPRGGISLDNAGYAIIRLKGGLPESEMPDRLTIPARATIIYDLEYTPGIRVENKLLREFTSGKDQDWRTELPSHSFWNNAGYVRITKIEGNQVTGRVYDSRINPISSFTLNNERKEATFRLPQFTSTTFSGEGQGKIILEGVQAPRITAKLLIDFGGQNVKARKSVGEKILDDTEWRVTNINVENRALGTGKVTIENRRTGQRKVLSIKALTEEEKTERKEIDGETKEEAGKAIGELIIRKEADLDFSWPTNDKAISPNGCFGVSRTGHTHAGIDIPGSKGESIYASAGGVVGRVVKEEDGDGGGKRIRVDHSQLGRSTWYMHLDTVNVKLNDEVKKGDVIGGMGNTGSEGIKVHLHFQTCKIRKTFYENCFDPCDSLDCSIAQGNQCSKGIMASASEEFKLAREKAELAFSFLPSVSAQSSTIPDNVRDIYSNAIEAYWEIVFNYPDLEIPAGEEGSEHKFWGVLALNKIENLAGTFSEGKIKEDFRNQAKEDRLRALNFLESRYPDQITESNRDILESSRKFNLDEATTSIPDKQIFNGIIIERTIDITLLQISVPDISDIWAEVFLTGGGSVQVSLHEGDSFLEAGGNSVTVKEIAEKYIIIGKTRFEQDDDVKDLVEIPGLRIKHTFSNIQSRPKVANILLSAINFNQRFTVGDRFLGREVDIRSDTVILRDTEVPIKSGGLSIRSTGLGGIKGSLNINFERFANIKIVPSSQGRIAESDFFLHIGIEKRGIRLSPEQMKRQANSSRVTAEKIKKITRSMEKTISTWRNACFATSGALFLKNFVEGYRGESFARERVIAAYKEECKDKIGFDKEYNLLSDCLRDREKGIDAAINTILEANREVDKLLVRGETKEGNILFEEDGYTRVNIEELKVVLNNKGHNLDDQLENIETFQKTSGQIVLSPSEVKDLLFNIEVESRSKEKEFNIVSGAYTEFANADKKLIETRGERFGRAIEQYNEIKESNKEALEGALTRSGALLIDPKKKEGNPDQELFNQFYSNFRSADVGYIGPNKKADGRDFVIIQNSDGKWVEEDVKIINGQIFLLEAEGEKKVTTSLGPLKVSCPVPEIGASTVRYYGSGSYRDLPETMPFPVSGIGDGYIQVSKYDNGRKPAEAIIVFPLRDGSCDKFLYFKGQTVPKTRDLAIQSAFRAIAIAISHPDKQPGKVISIPVAGENSRRYEITKEKLVTLESGCEDFMSPQDCEILYQTCDPVMCPASRFNLGGRWEVPDVVQTGLSGSLLLGLPNFPHPVVPICLPGIRAGLQNFASILDAHAACLDDAVKTGKTSGICDRIQSIYVCEMLWKEGIAIANINGGLLDTIGKQAFGVTKGGGEYLYFKESLDKVSESVQWFTSTYAAPVFTAFKSRTGQEVGTFICKSAFFGRLPGFASALSELAKPESPPQFFSFLEEIPHSSVQLGSQSSQSQYKVFFHIFAGEDRGISYRVYLKDRVTLPGEGQLFSYEIAAQRPKARGFLAAGDYLCRY